MHSVPYVPAHAIFAIYYNLFSYLSQLSLLGLQQIPEDTVSGLLYTRTKYVLVTSTELAGTIAVESYSYTYEGRA